MMEYFHSETDRTLRVKSAYPQVFEENPNVVSQQEAARICGVHIKTIQSWQKSGDLPFSWNNDHLLHYHEIKLLDLMTCCYVKYCLHHPGGDFSSALRRYYEKKCTPYPECLYTKDIVQLTGYVKQIVVRWIKNGHLRGYVGKKSRIPKRYFIDFLCGSYYMQIKRKSNIHKADMQSFLEEYQKIS